MKRSSIAAWIIIALIIIGIVILVITQFDDEPSELSSSDEKVRSTPFEKLSRRIQEIQIEIATQIDALNLTIEMQQYLDRKLNRTLVAVKFITGALLISLIVMLMLNGVEFWTAILTVSSFLCLGVPIVTFFFFKKIMDVKELVNWFFKKIKNLVYNRFGCDSATIYFMQSNVAAKQMTVKVLQTEIANFNQSRTL